jgi:hypothetical protein
MNYKKKEKTGALNSSLFHEFEVHSAFENEIVLNLFAFDQRRGVSRDIEDFSKAFLDGTHGFAFEVVEVLFIGSMYHSNLLGH